MNKDQIRTVLICDDEARVRQALKNLLLTREIVRKNDPSKEIQVVGEAGRGIDAIQMVKNLQPDVVIMDANMPGISGIESARLIKRNWPHIKIVMLTMYPDIRTAAIEAGVDTFLLKGCLSETLFNAILA